MWSTRWLRIYSNYYVYHIQERQLLFASPDDQQAMFSVPHRQYMNLVCPRDKPLRAVSPAAMPTGVLSLEQVRTLPLKRQVLKQ